MNLHFYSNNFREILYLEDPTLLGLQRPDYVVLYGLLNPRRQQRPVTLGQRELDRHALYGPVSFGVSGARTTSSSSTLPAFSSLLLAWLSQENLVIL